MGSVRACQGHSPDGVRAASIRPSRFAANCTETGRQIERNSSFVLKTDTPRGGGPQTALEIRVIRRETVLVRILRGRDRKAFDGS